MAAARLKTLQLCLWIYVKAMRRMEEDSGSLLLLNPGPCLSVLREVLRSSSLWFTTHIWWLGRRPQGIVASQIGLRKDLFPKNCDRPWSKNFQLGGRLCFHTQAFLVGRLIQVPQFVAPDLTETYASVLDGSLIQRFDVCPQWGATPMSPCHQDVRDVAHGVKRFRKSLATSH